MTAKKPATYTVAYKAHPFTPWVVKCGAEQLNALETQRKATSWACFMAKELLPLPSVVVVKGKDGRTQRTFHYPKN